MEGPGPYGEPRPTPPQTYSPPAYGQPGPSAGFQGGMLEVKERPFVVGLLLTIVTLGIYPFYWHYVTHDELHRQMGRRNEDKGLWIGYIALAVVPLIFLAVFLVQFVQFAIARETPPTEEEALGFLIGFGIWIALVILAAIASLVVFTIYTAKQWALLREAKERSGLQLRASAGAFFGLYYGGMAVNMFTGIPATWITSPIAYYFLQENYNDIARAIQARQLDAVAYGPGGTGWSQGPQQPPRPGPVPLAPMYGAPSPYAAPSPPPAAPSSYGGYPSSSWDAPADYTRPQAPPPQPPGPYDPDPAAPPRELPFRREEGPPAAAGPVVEQHFQCPRCHAHVRARGTPGTPVTIHCTQCGESGTVTMPDQ